MSMLLLGNPKATASLLSTVNRKTRIAPTSVFYTIDAKFINKTDTLEKRQASRLLWASRGRFIVIYSPGSVGVFEFYDAESKFTMAKDRHHDMCTNAAWDPTGRYLVTYISYWKVKTIELGFKFWSLKGQEIIDIPKTAFYQFLWRPRPSTLLSSAQKKELEDKLVHLEKKFKLEDEEKEEERSKGWRKERKHLKDKFYELMRQKKKEYESDEKWRHSVGLKEVYHEVKEEIVETVVSVKEEIQ
jgi:translation initiation factor 3 subunit B